jgi:hypothetical protein
VTTGTIFVLVGIDSPAVPVGAPFVPEDVGTEDAAEEAPPDEGALLGASLGAESAVEGTSAEGEGLPVGEGAGGVVLGSTQVGGFPTVVTHAQRDEADSANSRALKMSLLQPLMTQFMAMGWISAALPQRHSKSVGSAQPTTAAAETMQGSPQEGTALREAWQPHSWQGDGVMPGGAWAVATWAVIASSDRWNAYFIVGGCREAWNDQKRG